jgi:integrase
MRYKPWHTCKVVASAGGLTIGYVDDNPSVWDGNMYVLQPGDEYREPLPEFADYKIVNHKWIKKQRTRKAKKRANNEGSIYRRNDGRWVAEAKINGEMVYFYGKKQGEVKEKLEEAQDQARDGIYVKATKTTFDEWLGYWLNEIAKPEIKPATFDYYEYIIRVHIKPSLGKMALKDITTETLDRFYNRKKQEPKRRGEGTLSKKLVGDIRKVIGMALEKAVVKKKIAVNPNEYTEPIGKDEPEIEYLTPEEIAEFLDKISADFWHSAFVTALGTGLRLGELVALQWKHIDVTGGFIKVSQSAVEVNTYQAEGPKTRLIIQEPKTKKSIRKVPLPLDVIKILKIQQSKQREFKGNVIEITGEDYVFAWPDGRIVHPNYLSKHFKKLVKRYSQKDVHFHCLRHSYASMLLMNGEELKIIQENLGHKDIQTTSNMYTHVMDELKTRSAERLNGFTVKKRAIK